MIPYTQHTIDQSDIDAIVGAFRAGHLATGEIVREYEAAFALHHGYAHGVAINSGTAALWCAYRALGISVGDEVITSPLTFAATANMIVAVGATPVFADVDAGSLNITQNTVAEKVTDMTRLIVPVDFGGQIADVRCLDRAVMGLQRGKVGSAPRHKLRNIPVVVDAAHSVGVAATNIGVIRCYSTHAAKNMTTCEGGMILTNDDGIAGYARMLRNHGIDSDYHTRTSHAYSMQTLGFNFRLPDPLAALGLSQLRKLGEFNARREYIRAQYDGAFNGELGITLRKGGMPSSNHLYVVLLDLDALRYDRDHIFQLLRDAVVGVNVHYRPVYLFKPYARMGFQPGLCPNAEWAYARLLTLPLYPGMEQWQVEYVISTVKSIISAALK